MRIIILTILTSISFTLLCESNKENYAHLALGVNSSVVEKET
jgi:hypothetical protein